MKIKLILVTLLTFLTVSHAYAENAHDWIIRARAIYAKPDTKGKVSTLGGNVDASSDQVPEFDITRFITPNLAAELIVATTRHDISVNGSSLGASTNLGSVKLLPPTLTLQYHPMTSGNFRPYAGAGLNYTFFYDVKTGGAATGVKYQDHLGYALQAGIDYMIDERFGINFDVKKIFLKTHVQVNDSYTAKVRLDPWLVGTGISYRF